MLKHFGQAGIAVGSGELHDGQRVGKVEYKRAVTILAAGIDRVKIVCRGIILVREACRSVW